MTKLSDHQAGHYVKLMYIGDSGTGKTGSLVSLVKAGYKLKILDLDNGLDALRQFISHECPDNMDNVDYETLEDKVTMLSSGPITIPSAYIASLKLMNEWSDGTKLSSGGSDTIFVLDSLTALGRAAFHWAKSLAPNAKDPRQWYFAAQQSVESVIGMLIAKSFASNLIIISHINYKELQEGVHKGYPSAVGSAMGPVLPKYFNTMIQAEVIGTGTSTRRTIRTLPSSVIDLKNPNPFEVLPEYPLGTGLADIFEELKKLTGENE